MATGISSLVFVPLLAIFFAHIMWAFGSTWPVKDQKMLARTVAGFKGIEKMPPRFATFGVAIAAFAAGIIGLLLSDPETNNTLTLLGVLLAGIFLFRGILGFTSKWRELTPEEPFRTLDRKIYSPLCIGIGICFVTLVAMRLT